MKKPPDMENLETILRSSIIVAGGFLGTDSRSVDEIISSDLAELAETGVTKAELVERMKEITEKAISAMGDWTDIDEKHKARVEEAKGVLTCPWPHPGGFAKRITYVQNTDNNTTVKWTDLNIHLIEQHNFFEGKGAPYRVEPKEVVKAIF